jgi:hypothetical protein
MASDNQKPAHGPHGGSYSGELSLPLRSLFAARACLLHQRLLRQPFCNGTMHQPTINLASTAINPKGNLLSGQRGHLDSDYAKEGPCLQVFHFNGGNPSTGYSNILTREPIGSIAREKRQSLHSGTSTSGTRV